MVSHAPALRVGSKDSPSKMLQGLQGLAEGCSGLHLLAYEVQKYTKILIMLIFFREIFLLVSERPKVILCVECIKNNIWGAWLPL